MNGGLNTAARTGINFIFCTFLQENVICLQNEKLEIRLTFFVSLLSSLIFLPFLSLSIVTRAAISFAHGICATCCRHSLSLTTKEASSISYAPLHIRKGALGFLVSLVFYPICFDFTTSSVEPKIFINRLYSEAGENLEIEEWMGKPQGFRKSIEK
jgi:hypothetical protein